ncbi:MAG: VOC family protein [Alphaproteobacteria bacterium]|nr:VOC family protein [Alphaproteobacteria bacterium]
MIRPIVAVVVMSAAVGVWVGAALAQERPASVKAPAVRRTTLVVENLDKSIDFYQRLGLTKWYDKATTRGGPEGVIGADDLPLTEDPRDGRIVIMKGNDERVGMIGLLGYDHPPLASARSNLMGIGSGDMIIMIEVGDLQGAYTRLQQIGTRFHRTPYKYKVLNPDGSSNTGTRMFAYDPDGHLIEVAQPESK